MRAKVGLGILAGALLAAALIVGHNELFSPSVKAQQPLSVAQTEPSSAAAPSTEASLPTYQPEPSSAAPVPPPAAAQPVLSVVESTPTKPSPVPAYQPEPLPHVPVPPPEATQPIDRVKKPLSVPPTAVAEAPQPASVIIRFTAFVSPIFEGGAIGQPIPLTVDIRGERLFNERAFQKIPEKVKEALQSAMTEAANEEPPVDRRLDQVLERLDKIEKQLKKIERGRAGK